MSTHEDAKDPKDLFIFKGLSVKTLELASVFEAGKWDFKIDGTADLNAADLEFDTEIKSDSGKVTYVATLTSQAGITLKDVAGRDVPGFDKVAKPVNQVLMIWRSRRVAVGKSPVGERPVLSFCADELAQVKLRPVCSIRIQETDS